MTVEAPAFDAIRPGDELPPRPLALTLQRLVMEAGVNRDFAPIHHDGEIARATGAAAPFANVMLIQALLEATLREWMGLDGRLCKLGLSMRSFAPAGSVMTGHGRVTATRADAGGGLVDLEVWTEAAGHRAAVGTATVWLPVTPTSPAEHR
jgi:acyl dehydratase